MFVFPQSLCIETLSKGKIVSAWLRGVREGKGGSGGKGREMTQTLYAHMNIIKKKETLSHNEMVCKVGHLGGGAFKSYRHFPHTWLVPWETPE
jgi:hypothetical protein